MEEIEVKYNPLGVKVFINGRPDVNNMTEEEYGLFTSSLELRMSEYFEKKKRKQVTHTGGKDRDVKRLP